MIAPDSIATTHSVSVQPRLLKRERAALCERAHGGDRSFSENVLAGLHGLSRAQLTELEAWLRPHQSSVSGFLAANERLLAVVVADTHALYKAGTTPQAVGLRLQEVLIPYISWNYHASERLRERYHVPEHLYVRAGSFLRGGQPCPFWECEPGLCHSPSALLPHEEAYAHADFVITNEHSGETVKGPCLLAHTATSHNFFEGSVRYRTDPVALARVLEVI